MPSLFPEPISLEAQIFGQRYCHLGDVTLLRSSRKVLQRHLQSYYYRIALHSPFEVQCIQDDCPSALLLLWQGTFHISGILYVRSSVPQVIGDLWERYLDLLDSGVHDGYLRSPSFFTSFLLVSTPPFPFPPLLLPGFTRKQSYRLIFCYWE